MKLYASRTYQQPRNSEYAHPAEVTTAEDLRAVVAWDHAAAKYQDNHRATDNFIEADCIMMDVDNAPGKGQPDIPPEEWRDLDAIRADLPGVSFYAATSRNHMKVKDGRPPRPKYHLYFEIPRTTSAEEYRQIKLAITARLPYFDTNATDAARVFTGNKAAEVQFFPGQRLITDWIRTTPDPTPQHPVELNQQRPQRTGVDNGLYDMQQVLYAIPCAQLTMKEWVQCGMALKALGYDVDTWDAWSQTDSARYKRGECARRWRSFKRAGVGGTYLITLAESYGWQRPERQPKKKEGQRMSIEAPAKELRQDAVQQTVAADPEPASISYIDALLQDFQTKRYEPIPTGIPGIDQVINAGFIRQTLVTLGAAPGAGKTMLAQQILEHIAVAGRADVLYFNLEMSRAQLLARSLSRLTGYSATTIMRGYQWNNTQRAEITAAAAAYRETVAPHMVYEDQHSSDYQKILKRMEEGYTRRKDQQLPFIVCIDYLQLLTSEDVREEGVEIIKHSLKAFKDFATRTGSVIFMIMAHSRAINESGAITQGAGRDTSAIEYSGDLQLSLNYAKIADGTYASKAAMRRAIAEGKLTKDTFSDIALVCTKNRFGPPDTVCGMKMEPKKNLFVIDEPTEDRAPAPRRNLY
jgi:replicative DNA helicase